MNVHGNTERRKGILPFLRSKVYDFYYNIYNSNPVLIVNGDKKDKTYQVSQTSL